MNKRVIGLLLAVCMSFPTPAWGADGQEIAAVYLNESFTGYTGNTPAGWEPKGNNEMFAEQVDETLGVSLKTTPNATSNDVNITMGFKPAITGKVVLEAKVLATDSEFQRALFVCKDSGGNENLLLTMDRGGVIFKQPDKSTVTTYTPNQWLHLQVVLDIAAKTFDVYANGKEAGKGLPMPAESFANLKSVCFKSWKGGVTYYDDIRVYEGDQPLDEAAFQDLVSKQGQRLTAEQIRDKKLENALVYCVDSPFAYVRQEQQQLEVSPYADNSIAYVPVALTCQLLQIAQPEGLSGTTEHDGVAFMKAADLARALGMELFENDDGLLIFSHTKQIFDPVTDVDTLNDVLNLVTYRTIAPEDVTPEIYKQLREKWKVRLVGDGNFDPNDPEIAKQIENINKTAKDVRAKMLTGGNERAYLWEDCASTTLSKYVTQNYDNIKKMATAYCLKGGELYQDQSLKEDIIGALEWMYENRYNDHMAEYENWWEWEIGTPQQLNDIMALMYDDLTQEQIQKYVASIAHFISEVPEGNTGANRVWKAMCIAISGIMSQDFDRVLKGRDALLQTFDYSTSGDGFYEDGSFIQHAKHAYTMGYGKSMLGDLCNAMYFFENTIFEITNPKKKNVYRWIYDSFEPLMYQGAAMQMASGREISRNYDDHYVGHKVMQAILLASLFAPDEYKGDLQSMIKKWMLQDTERDFVKSVPFYLMVEAKRILNDDTIVPKDDLTIYKQYAAMDEAVQHRNGYAFAVSMSSARCATFEAINNENLKGWYTNDGMTYLYNDASQYTHDYWPTINPYRLPGITTDDRKKPDSEGTGKLTGQSFVGGVEIGGVFGVSAMQFAGYHNTLTAKKSYFAFDDEIVCMGTDINSTDGTQVSTIVENRQLNDAGDNVFVVNGQTTVPGFEAQSIPQAMWAHLSGNKEGADIGYYFPSESSIELLREQRTGCWYDINQNYGDNKPITKNYLNIWIDHGKNPQQQSYYYVLLPNKSADETKAYAQKPDIRILRNDNQLQMVQDATQQVTGMVFWEKGETDLVKVSAPAIVGLWEKDGQVILDVSDPTQKLQTLTVELKLPVQSVISQDAAASVNQTPSGVSITFDVTGSIGRTFEVVFAAKAQ